MFCGKCGAQVPDGAAVCPKCGNKMENKEAMPKVANASQNAGTQAISFLKSLDNKTIGIIATCAVAVIAVILIFKALFGGIKLDGRYTDGYFTYTFSGNEVTFYCSGTEFTVNYKIKNDKLIYDLDTLELSEACIDYCEDYLLMDDDEIEDKIESIKEHREDPIKIEYDKKNKTLKIGGGTYYNAENYKVGPSGEYTCEDDDDITITFEDGELTFDNDGDDVTVPYNCFKKGDEVWINFYSFDFENSEFYHTYFTSVIEDVDVDEIVLGDTSFEK